MQWRVDPALPERPVSIRRKVARLAIPLRGRFKAMRTFVAIGTGLSFHRTEPRLNLPMTVHAAGCGVGALQ
ncbi:hypothetical protein DRQ32_12100 [bacterium]|nr:MAG: hypothetical protein DRQ32_12100 [bacterium]